MMQRAHWLKGRLITAAFLPIFLLLPQAGSAAQPGGKATVASVRAVAEAKLLLDGDYFTALVSGIDRARSEISLSAYLFRTIENA